MSEARSVTPDPLPRTSETVVAEPTWLVALIWVMFPLLGAGAGLLAVQAADWLAALRRLPFLGPARLIASLPEPQVWVGAAGIGAFLGLGLAYLAARDRLEVTVGDGRVVLTRTGASREIEGPAVTAVFMDGKRLVLLGAASEELAGEVSDLDAGELARAFGRHGYRWCADGDPHKGDYRRWVEGLPEMPPGADAVFRVRQKALENKHTDDARDLRVELARLGIVTRDEQARQYWRRTNPAAEDG
jgi:hypothetical protein